MGECQGGKNCNAATKASTLKKKYLVGDSGLKG